MTPVGICSTGFENTIVIKPVLEIDWTLGAHILTRAILPFGSNTGTIELKP